MRRRGGGMCSASFCAGAVVCVLLMTGVAGGGRGRWAGIPGHRGCLEAGWLLPRWLPGGVVMLRGGEGEEGMEEEGGEGMEEVPRDRVEALIAKGGEEEEEEEEEAEEGRIPGRGGGPGGRANTVFPMGGGRFIEGDDAVDDLLLADVTGGKAWAEGEREGEERLNMLLVAAIKSGLEDRIISILDRGANPNCIDASSALGESPLQAACARGMLKTALALLSRGAMLDFSDQDGNTPLHDACLAGHADIVEALISRGANANASNSLGMQPLHCAAANGHVACIRRNAAALNDEEEGINGRTVSGATALHWAAGGGHAGAVRALLRLGADVAMADLRGVTPLRAAAGGGGGREEVVRVLRAAQAMRKEGGEWREEEEEGGTKETERKVASEEGNGVGMGMGGQGEGEGEGDWVENDFGEGWGERGGAVGRGLLQVCASGSESFREVPLWGEKGGAGGAVSDSWNQADAPDGRWWLGSGVTEEEQEGEGGVWAQLETSERDDSGEYIGTRANRWGKGWWSRNGINKGEGYWGDGSAPFPHPRCLVEQPKSDPLWGKTGLYFGPIVGQPEEEGEGGQFVEMMREIAEAEDVWARKWREEREVRRQERGGIKQPRDHEIRPLDKAFVRECSILPDDFFDSMDKSEHRTWIERMRADMAGASLDDIGVDPVGCDPVSPHGFTIKDGITSRSFGDGEVPRPYKVLIMDSNESTTTSELIKITSSEDDNDEDDDGMGVDGAFQWEVLGTQAQRFRRGQRRVMRSFTTSPGERHAAGDAARHEEGEWVPLSDGFEFHGHVSEGDDGMMYYDGDDLRDEPVNGLAGMTEGSEEDEAECSGGGDIESMDSSEARMRGIWDPDDALFGRDRDQMI